MTRKLCEIEIPVHITKALSGLSHVYIISMLLSHYMILIIQNILPLKSKYLLSRILHTHTHTHTHTKFADPYSIPGAFQVELVLKNPLANTGHLKDLGSIIGSGDPLEEEMEPHSNILWRSLWTEELVRLQSMGPQKVEHD